MSVGINLFFLFIIGSGIVSCEIFPKNIVVEEGQGFILWLKQSIDIVECSLEFNNPANTFYHNEREEQQTAFGLIQSMPRLDSKECAFRVKGVSKQSEGQWSIIYSYDQYAKNRDAAHVKVVAPKDQAETENCWLYNPQTQEKKMCSESDATSSSDNWQRHSLVSGSMEGKSSWINGPAADSSDKSFPVLPPMAVHGSFKFGQLKSTPGMNHILLECASTSGNRNCKVKHLASNRVFNVRPGLQSSDKRYAAFYTNRFDMDRCQFEINQPIQLKDVGIWEMTAGSGKCHFLVRPSLEDSFVLKTKEPNSSSFMKTKPVSNLTIPCAHNLFYPMSRCYIIARSPTDPEIEMEYKNAVDLSKNGGKCEFSKDSSVNNWYCSYSGPSMENTDIDLSFIVKRYKTDLVEAKLEVQRDHSVTIECHEINGDPIEACAIIDPEGRVYSVPSDTFEDTKQSYSYYGIGLARGNCGIRIVHALNVKTSGTWKFFVTMQDGKEHFLDYNYSDSQ